MLQKIKLSCKTIAVASAFLLVGCGGGGSSSGVNLPSKPDSSKMAKIDDDNANQSSFLVYRAINLLFNNKLLKMDDTEFSYNSNKNTKKINRSDRIVKQSCDSGTIKANINESDKTAIIYYNNCLNGGAIYNGKAKYYYYNEDEHELDFENTTVKIDEVNIDIKKANIYYIGDEPYEMTKVYMSMDVQGKKIEYFNFNYYLNGNEDGIKFNGYVKPYCLDGYLYTETKGRIKNVDQFYKLDPIGSFIVKSNKEVKVDLDGDLIYLTLPNKIEEVYRTNEVSKALDSPSCSVDIKQTVPTRPKRADFAKLNSSADKDTKIASAAFKASNLDINEKMPYIENIYNDIDSGLSCVSGSVNEQDNGNKIEAEYKNCEIANNIVYDGNISFKLDGADVSKMTLNNLKIKSNGKISIINKATILKKLDDGYSNEIMFFVNNLYAKIDGNEYLNFNLKHLVDDSKNMTLNGYIKPSCIGKYLYIKDSSITYDTDDNLSEMSLAIADKPKQDLKDDDIDSIVLYISLDTTDNSVSIGFPLGSETNMSLGEFLNKCK